MNRILYLLLSASACDDTLFGPPFKEGAGAPNYGDDWAGVEDMFDDHCAGCHPSLNAFTLTALEADVRDGVQEYVVPGDAEASQLWRIVANQGAEGDAPTMPLGSQGLSVADSAGFRAWIDNGAALPDGG